MGNYCVYVHSNKVNWKKYVGITSQDVSRRWKNGSGYYENEHFTRAIQKYGWDSFTHEVVKTGLSKKEACTLEIDLIRQFRSNEWQYGYNKSTGGESPASGHRHTEETKKKMSLAHKGQVISEEQKKKIGDKARMRGNGKLGKTGEQCMKAGIVQQINRETGEVIAEFFGYDEMRRKTGFQRTPVLRAATGKQNQSYGYAWRYIPRGKNHVSV